MQVPKIFVTQPLAHPALDRLYRLGEVKMFADASRIAPRADVLRGVADADVLCCLLHDRIDAEVIDAAGRLRLIATGAINPANLDARYAAAKGILVSVIPNLVAETTADLQWALLLAAARRVVEGDRAVRGGVFPGSQSLHFAGGEVHGKTLGTFGFGAIGRGVARRARGFGMKVLYSKPHRLSLAEEQEWGVEYRSFDDLVAESDFLCLNASYTPAMHHVMGEREFNLMKGTAYLINTSRGPMVDEVALARALREGRIAGAALDVFEREPDVDPGLLDLSNVVLTPHLGSASRDTRLAIASVIADNVEAFLAGQPLPNPYSAGDIR